MSIHLFLHVGATKWLGFDTHSVLLVGACLSPERGMEKKPHVIVDYTLYTKASAFGLLKDQTADVRERAKAAYDDLKGLILYRQRYAQAFWASHSQHTGHTTHRTAHGAWTQSQSKTVARNKVYCTETT